jgi:uncharacterized RDD family membrane protein YckC
VYCSKCGSVVDERATFCSKCGQATSGAAVTAGGAPVAGALNMPLAGAAVPVAATAPLGASGVTWANVPVRAYAGFWLRFLAYIVDIILLGIFEVPILFGLAMMMGLGAAIGSVARHGGENPFENGPPPVFFGFISMFFLVTLLGGWLYHGLLESSEWQATAGKKILGVYVTDLAGQRVSFARASGRHFAKIITSLIPLGIGYILAGFTEKKQAVHDMLASCLVLRRN